MFTPPDIERVPRPGGGFVLRSRRAAPPYARCLGDLLVHWAAAAPERVFLAERVGGEWRRVSYAETLCAVRGLAQALIDLGVTAPVLVLSGNSIDHALLMLAAMHVGVPIAPVSPAYSLASKDHVKLRALAGVVAPGAVFVADRDAYGAALAALAPEVPVLDVAELARTPVTEAVDRAFAAIDGETIAKLLFTSGSTGVPKAVINTQRMLCSNQAALAAGWSFLAARPPVIVDWLPWSHTFGANHNFNLVLAHGGTLYIDGGKPAPGAFDETVRNLREIASTVYFNVPRGFDMLVAQLETDAALRETFFRELDVLFYAAAALSPATWDRLAAVAARAGRKIAMTSAWGSTETSPLVTQVCFPIARAGVIGVPVPGVELAFVPSGDKLEMRVRGPNVSPGYLRADGTVEPLPLDELGFYPMGDAGVVDDVGVSFDGRTSENFKLSSGTWIHVGELRIALIAACSPLIADAVITGHNRDQLGALVIPARSADPAFRGQLAAALARHAAAAAGSSTLIARALILDEPPSIDAGEITDKGYLNQRAMIERRADAVARLYGDDPAVIDVGEASLWFSRWRDGRIGFHEGRANAFLERHVERLGFARRVLVPLCGKTEDLAFLAARGHIVIGIELVEAAVRAFFSEHAVDPVVTPCGVLTRYTAGAITIYTGDIFAATTDVIGPVDALYDRAALIALPAATRARYIAHLRTLLPAAPGLLITLEYPQDRMAGPPFAVLEAEVHSYYAAERIDEVTADTPRLRELGIAAIEKCFAIRI